MAHTFDASLYSTASTDPVSFSYTCGTGATVFVLAVGIVGGTARAGGIPTFGGKLLTEISTPANIGGETVAELFALTNPSTGASYSVSVPNTNTAVLRIFASSYKAQSGYTSVFDVSYHYSATATNPSSNITPSAAGNILVQAFSTGANAALSICYPGHFVAPQGDLGNYQVGSQWYVAPSTTAFGMGFTTANEDCGLITGVWKEELPPALRVWGGILKYYNGTQWTECPSSKFQIYLGGTWTICPSRNFKIYRPDVTSPGWYPIRFQG